MMKKYLSITALMAATAFSCEKAVDINVPFENPKLVLNGFLNPDSSIAVHVSKSQFVLDETPLKNITDARVFVYEGDELLGELEHQENGFYKAEGVFPWIGKEYTILAEKEGFPEANAQQGILPSVEPLNLTFDTLKTDEYGGRKIEIEFEVNDPAGEENYYYIRLFEKGVGYYYTFEGDTIIEPYFHPASLESPDPILEPNCPNWNGCGLLVSDDYFNGKTYRMKFSGGINYGYRDTEEREVILALYHVPESFYRFYKTLENNRNTTGNPFAEPAKVFTNVEGGYGLWSSLTPTLYNLPLK